MIDALDPRGGIAFASRRAFSLSEESHALRDAPCVWIAPPAFQPEPVISRMLGWAAERGAFQLGVFENGEELRFATLDAVTEFVRRVYLRSGGGDGLDGGGPPLPPLPPEPGPDLSPLPTEIEGGEGPSGGGMRLSSFLALVRTFTEAGKAQETARIAGQSFSWIAPELEQTSSYSLSAGQPDGAHIYLQRAAALVLHEMLMRLPSSDSPEEMDRWQTAARALGCILDDVGIWELLLRGPLRSKLTEWAKAVSPNLLKNLSSRRELSEIVNYLDHEEGIVGFFFLIFGPFAVYNFHFGQFIRYYDIYAPLDRRRRVEFEPIEALALLPLPGNVKNCVSDMPHEANLTHLLYAVIGSPSVLIEDGSGGEDAAAILLLAACWVVGQASDMPAPAWDAASSLQLFRLDKLNQRAWEWLALSLPKLAFPAAIEEMIKATSSLRYRASELSGPETVSQQ